MAGDSVEDEISESSTICGELEERVEVEVGSETQQLEEENLTAQADRLNIIGDIEPEITVEILSASSPKIPKKTNSIDIEEESDWMKITASEVEVPLRRKMITEEDSSSEEESSEEEEEFMPDGERVRKQSRGFKQLNNCKRFWKASLLMG